MFSAQLPKFRRFQHELTVKILVQICIKFNLPMALDVLFCRDLIVTVENSAVRTFTLFSKSCYFYSTVWAVGTGKKFLIPKHVLLAMK